MKHPNKVSETSKKLTDTELDKLEEKIPNLAREATRKAYAASITSGHSVVRVIDDTLYEVFPNGTQRLIKKITQNRHVAANRKFHIK